MTRGRSEAGRKRAQSIPFEWDGWSLVPLVARETMLMQTGILDGAKRSNRAMCRIVGFALVSLTAVFIGPACERSPADKEAGTPSSRSESSGPESSHSIGPNIVFVLVDTLRADKVGAYGHAPSLTPTIDAVASEGVTIERAVAQAPWTQPSVASLFSSYNPSVHRVFSYRQIPAPKPDGDATHEVAVFSAEFQTLAECLQAGGYVTGGIVANPFTLAEYGFAQGFDHYDTTMADRENLASGDVVNEAALTWLSQRDPSKPFFLYLHYMDVHGPYNAGPEFVDRLLNIVEGTSNKRLLTPRERSQLGYLGKLPPNCPNPQKHQRLKRFREYWVARYEAGIREFDHHFADLRARLSEMDLWDDTYVIITSDHGEALCEHGLWSHGYTTHHTDLHVPLILRWPSRLPTGKWISGTVRLIDVMPTVLSQLSLPVPDGIQGVSLVPLIGDQPLPEPLPALAEGVKIGPKQQAIYYDDWKLIVSLETGRRQLYNLYDDYAEQFDLSVREAERVNTLSTMLEQLTEANDRLAVDFASGRATLPAEQVERLKSLGYVGD